MNTNCLITRNSSKSSSTAPFAVVGSQSRVLKELKPLPETPREKTLRRMSVLTPMTAALLLLVTAIHQTNTQHVHLSNKRTPPLLSKVPDTSFSCSDHRAGYYADMEADCQAYHMCDTLGRQFSYLCPNMTVFNQRFMVCDHWHHVNCTNSGNFYDLNMRMAGGGEKLPQMRRSENLINNDDLKRRLLVNSRGPTKSTEIARAIKKSELKKVKDQLLNTQRRVTATTQIRRVSTPRPISTLVADTATRVPPKRSSASVEATTTKVSSKPISPSVVATTTRAPPKQEIKTSRSTFLRPLTNTSTGSFSFTQTFVPNVRTTTQSGQGTRTSSTTQPSTTSVRTPANLGLRPSFGVTELRNFREFGQNQSQVSPPPPIVQMLPGMVARGSGPRFGFGATNLVKPPPHHFSIPREILDNPLFLELSRQILLPRQRFAVNVDTQPERSNENSVDSTRVTLNPTSTSKFVFPRTNLVSFPIQPLILNRNTTPKPFVMTGPRQEYPTELEAKRNGRQKVPLEQLNVQSPALSNQAFFIPETRLIPPDDIKIPVSLPKPNTTSEVTRGSVGDQTLRTDHHNHSHDHMTMIFPDSRHKPRAESQIGGIILNPDCPECHPAFLTPGKCTPCVRIR